MKSLGYCKSFNGAIHFHCFKLTQQQRNIQANHFKADESFVIHAVTESSLKVSTREDAPKIFATGNYVVIVHNMWVKL